MDIIQAIKERRSVRSYNGEPLTAEAKEELMTFASEVQSPFGGNVTIRLREFALKEGYKPNTYGMIKGATDFFLLGFADDRESLLTAGFSFEKVVLKAWTMGLGTCWIAATFKGSQFDDGQTWPHGEQLRIVCPVGVAVKQSFMEKVTRFTIGSKNRKSFGTLFFSENFDTPLSEDSQYGKALEMMRLAPSSTNSQPWRALVQGDTVHFYYIPKSKISVLDCGIGLCHFNETEKHYGRAGTFFTSDQAPVAPVKLKYLVSYTRH